MLNKIKNETISYVVIIILLGALAYSVKTAHKIETEITFIKDNISNNKTKLETVSEQIASIQLESGTLTPQKLNELISKLEINVDTLPIYKKVKATYKNESVETISKSSLPPSAEAGECYIRVLITESGKTSIKWEKAQCAEP